MLMASWTSSFIRRSLNSESQPVEILRWAWREASFHALGTSTGVREAGRSQSFWIPHPVKRRELKDSRRLGRRTAGVSGLGGRFSRRSVWSRRSPRSGWTSRANVGRAGRANCAGSSRVCQELGLYWGGEHKRGPCGRDPGSACFPDAFFRGEGYCKASRA